MRDVPPDVSLTWWHKGLHPDENVTFDFYHNAKPSRRVRAVPERPLSGGLAEASHRRAHSTANVSDGSTGSGRSDGSLRLFRPVLSGAFIDVYDALSALGRPRHHVVHRDHHDVCVAASGGERGLPRGRWLGRHHGHLAREGSTNGSPWESAWRRRRWSIGARPAGGWARVTSLGIASPWAPRPKTEEDGVGHRRGCGGHGRAGEWWGNGWRRRARRNGLARQGKGLSGEGSSWSPESDRSAV